MTGHDHPRRAGAKAGDDAQDAAAVAARWPCLQPDGAGGSVLRLAAAPGSRRTGADGLHDGCLRVRLVAPAVDGKANDALLDWLAAELRLPRRSVRLLRGQTARRKQVAVDIAPAAVARWLDAAMGAEGSAGPAAR